MKWFSSNLSIKEFYIVAWQTPHGFYYYRLIFIPSFFDNELPHDAIRNVMYVFAQENGHTIWKKQWYALTLGISLWTYFYMTWEDHVFVVDVVVIDLTWETITLSVIIWPVHVATKLNTIVKIHKYKGLHEGHHFILMAMEVHNTLKHDMDHFIKECAHLFHVKQSGGCLSLSFCIQFFRRRVSIAL
jgi:hypothetical protein